MDRLEIQTTLTLADWRALQSVCAVRVQQRGYRGGLWIALGILAGMCGYWACEALGIALDLTSVAFGILLLAGLRFVSRKRQLDASAPQESGSFFATRQFVFGADGITASQKGASSYMHWERVTDVTATTEHIFVWVDRQAAYVIPVRDLPADISAEQAATRLREWLAGAGAIQETLPAIESDAIDEPVRSSAAAVATVAGRAAQAIFRLLTVRAADSPESANRVLSGKSLPIVLLTALSCALWIGLDWLRNLPEPQFISYELPSLAWPVLAALLIAVTMAKRTHPQIALSRACMLLAIVIPLLLVADFMVESYLSEQWMPIARVVLGLYAVAYCARGLQSLTGDRQPAAVMSALAVALVFFWGSSVLYVHPSFWLSREAYEESTESDGAWNDGESLLFDQSARIDASAAQIVRPSSAEPVGFFVGFAGYGDQRVFAEEIKFAAQVFGERYDTVERSLLLINDRRDLQAQPLASVSGLRYALKAVAARMQLDRDILFLALSSHGSDDPLLSVSNGTLPLRSLTGEALAEALHESGIKWRVIVISACHSGAFIESLQDPYTIVITAAAAERTSFGCSDERDLTYFGEAFFRDSLPKAASLREALELTKQRVGDRERKEGFKASQPQGFFGERIEARLAEALEGRSTRNLPVKTPAGS